FAPAILWKLGLPEMVEFCGRRFQVSRRVWKTYFSGSISTMRMFRTDHVVTLDGQRCSGAAHDGCQRAYTISWREEWRRKLDNASTARAPGRVIVLMRLHYLGRVFALRIRLRARDLASPVPIDRVIRRGP